MPVLTIHWNLHNSVCFLCDLYCWNFPWPSINIQLILWNFLSLRHWCFTWRVYHSRPKSISQMRSFKFKTISLMSLWGSSICRSTIWIVQRRIRRHIVIKCLFFTWITHCLLFWKLLCIVTNGNRGSSRNRWFRSSKLHRSVWNE